MHVSSPGCTRLGFTEAGIERAHCHHSPVSSGNCLTSGNCAGGKPCAETSFIGIVSPIAIAVIAKKSLVFFKVSSSLSMGQASLRGPALYRLSLIMCTTAKFNSTFCAPTEAMQERSLKLAQKSKCEVGFPSVDAPFQARENVGIVAAR